MADVYLACTQGPGGFQKLLVVKLARFCGDPLLSRMFLDEARLAAQLSHPNVVQTFEVGEDASRHYIVMEYLDGATFSRLRQRASAIGGVPLRLSVQILCSVLEGLEYAHNAQGFDGKPLRVVHRDLSPSNIIITAQGVTKILDFGIAKAADSYSFTQAGRYGGKVTYMPPEQIRAESVDERADIFSVGVTLAESALGHRFWGNTPEPLIASRLAAEDIPRLAEQAELDPELVRICDRALSPKREQRYPNAAAFKSDLTHYLTSLGGPLPQQELGAFVASVAGEERARLQSVIDEQVKQLAKSSSEIRALSLNLPRLEPTPPPRLDLHSAATVHHERVPSIPSLLEAPTLGMSVQERSALLPLPPQLPLTASRWPKARVLAAAAGGVVTLAIGAALLWPRSGASSAAPAPLTSAPGPAGASLATARPSATEAPPTAPTSVRLEVNVSPAEASITLDGASLGANPYVGVVISDAAIHELEVTAEGYQPLRQRLTFDRDVILRLHLQPRRRSSSAVSAAPVARSRERERQVAEPPESKPVVAVKPVAPTPTPAPEARPDSGKRTIDTTPFEDTRPKRQLDSDVFEQPSKPKSSIDRENPWP